MRHQGGRQVTVWDWERRESCVTVGPCCGGNQPKRALPCVAGPPSSPPLWAVAAPGRRSPPLPTCRARPGPEPLGHGTKGQAHSSTAAQDVSVRPPATLSVRANPALLRLYGLSLRSAAGAGPACLPGTERWEVLGSGCAAARRGVADHQLLMAAGEGSARASACVSGFASIKCSFCTPDVCTV